jgi:hypothetical protein
MSKFTKLLLENFFFSFEKKLVNTEKPRFALWYKKLKLHLNIIKKEHLINERSLIRGEIV